jgi:hypothetical protein
MNFASGCAGIIGRSRRCDGAHAKPISEVRSMRRDVLFPCRSRQGEDHPLDDAALLHKSATLRRQHGARAVRPSLLRRNTPSGENVLTPEDLVAFEHDVAEAFNAGKIHAPIHLSGGNELQLIRLFGRYISPECWIFSTYRSHYHALLHGIPREKIMAEILAGRSMNLTFPEHRFFTSAMVGGILPIATGVALALKQRNDLNHVFCFVGDMAARSGAFHEALQYASGHDLPINFVVEDNGVSCDTPTKTVWGWFSGGHRMGYEYERHWPHNGTGRFVTFV